MKKLQLMDKLDYLLHAGEEKAVNDFSKVYLRMLDDSDLPEDKKSQCRDILNKLMHDSIAHIKILKDIAQVVVGSDKDDF